jgi:hypothetical protein
MNARDLDIRVRDRNLKSGLLAEKDLQKHIAGLADSADNADIFSVPQPALDAPEEPEDDEDDEPSAS